MRWWRSVWVGLHGAAVVGVGFLFWSGWPYYRLPYPQRVHSPLHWTWKSGGPLGHLLGVVGSLMMVVMLAYSLRKRVRWFRWGSLRSWLNFHMFLGIYGPLLVILHSTFRVHGLVALSFWSMVVVAVSGFVGRYLYVHIPRRRDGAERALEEVQKELEVLLEETSPALQAWVVWASAAPDVSFPLWRFLLHLIVTDFLHAYRLRRLPPDLPGDPERRRKVCDRLRHAARLHRRIVIYERLQDLFHYWHVLHKPFAMVMYLFMVVHVAVALYTGYGP